MNELLIQNASISSPDGSRIADVYIHDGKIKDIGPNVSPRTKNILNAKGLYLCPGFVDMHVHFRDPGQIYKEDILTGTKAAAAGGVTAVACMPNTVPPADCSETIRYMLQKAKHVSARVYPIGAVTKNQAGKELTDFLALKQAGAVALSDDGHPVESAALMLEAMKKAKEVGLPIISHCEDLSIIAGGKINEGEMSEKLGVKGMDRASEDCSTAREIALSAAWGLPVHIAHVSTKGAIAFIRDAKRRGVPVTCETAPHYFTLTDQMLINRDADYRMNPPLRTQEDVEAVLEGICDGTVDAIATDHAPHSPEEKGDFFSAPNGVIGLETSFCVSYTRLVREGYISLNRLIQMMSLNPAKILNLPSNCFTVGEAADLVLFDPEEQHMIRPEHLMSRSKNTPFKNMTFYGKIKYTLLNGEFVYKSEDN